MNFSTAVNPGNYAFNLSHTDKVLSFGSCFSENIGERLRQHQFDVLVNPFGILFNPMSITKAIEECLVGKVYGVSDLKENQGIYFSFNHHSSFSSLNPEEAVEKINKSIRLGKDYITSSNTLILTLGSAWVYRLKETKEIVANCYKVPSEQFTKELLSVSEIVKSLNLAIRKIKEVNPKINIITTVSPVRHWKDGVVENQQSKATLLLALKEVNEAYPDSVYFPSYEIMMDELRDYRFYAKDMLHPSEVAIDYIWQKFSQTFFTKSTQELNKKIFQLNKEKNHKPFNTESEEFIKFSKRLVEKENKLYAEFPFLKGR